jgi:hypothetical protein
VSEQKTFPSPVRGWIENENLALNQGIGASVLENWFPKADTVRLRGGALKVADIGSAAVTSLVPYRTTVAKLFAANSANVYDITLLNPDTTPVASISSLTGGDWSYVQFATAGGEFLVMANGADPIHYYNGSVWNPIVAVTVHSIGYDGQTQAFVAGRTLSGGTSGATATIVSVQPFTTTTGNLRITGISGTFQDNETLTGSAAGGSALANGASSSSSTATITGVTTSALSRLWTHGNRVWAVEKDSLSAWYLDVDQFGGAATEFFLGGVFKAGGSLLFGETWSTDSGSGMDDHCVFVSTMGEVAVYAGTDPSSGETWALSGRYQIGRPVSAETIRAGGDLLIATVNGIVPVSAVMQKDPAALSTAAVTVAIEPSWRRVMGSLAAGQIKLGKWAKESMGVVGLPHRDGIEAFVVNMQTGGWCKYTGLDVQCMGLHNDLLYFGDAAGNVFLMEGSGADNGLPYVARMSLLPSHLGEPGNVKSVHLMRATFRALAPFMAKLSVATDYRKEFPIAPSVSPDPSSTALWDVGLWDVSRWDDGPDSETRLTATTRWKSMGRTGTTASPQVQVTCGGNRRPDAELVTLDLLYEQGGLVV